MNKPIQLVIADLKSDLSNAVNNTPLPMCCITPAIKELYEQCILIEKEQFKQAKEKYESSINKEDNHNILQPDITD